MSEFKKVEAVEDLILLDEDEILDGYRAGLSNAPEPGSDKSRAFWHGWRNGMCDRGLIPPDVEMQRLVRSYLGARVNAH